MEAHEAEHLARFDKLLTERRVRPTALVPLWRLAGFALGAGTALMGPKAAHACTEAVENVIEEHYAGQVAELADREPGLSAELAQFRELAAFAQFGSDLDAKTKAQLERGTRIVELFKQPAFSPAPIELQVAILFGMQKNFFDAIDAKKVVAAAASMKEFFATRKDALLTEIRTKAALDKDLEAKLQTACDEWKASFAG